MPGFLRRMLAQQRWRQARIDDPVHRLGRRSERVAARYLRRRGYRVVARNAQAGGVEIDLLCFSPDRRTIVVVEVKSGRVRGSDPIHAGRDDPVRNLRRAQRRRLVHAMDTLTRANRWSDRPKRIDVVAVLWPESGAPRVSHYPGAITAADRGSGRERRG